VDVLHGLGGFPEGQAKINAVGKTQGHDICVVFTEFQRGSVLRQGGDVHLEEIDRELTVDVMELIFVLAVILIQIRLINFLQVVKVVGAFGIHAFVDDEVLTVLLTCQSMGAVRTLEGKGFGETVLIRRKEGPADLTHQLAGLAVVTIQERLRCIAGRAGAILRDITHRAAADRLNRFSVLPRVVAVKILPVPVLLMIDNLWKMIHFELLVLRRMRIVESPLLERDISADEVDQPAVLLIKLVAQLNKIKYNVHEHCLLWYRVCLAMDIIPQKGRSMLYLFESPIKTRFMYYKWVVVLTLPFLLGRRYNGNCKSYRRSGSE